MKEPNSNNLPPMSNHEEKKLTIKEKVAYMYRNITVEPFVACYIMPSALANLATQNLSLEKACRVNIGYSTNVCDALTSRLTTNYTKEEAEVQQVVAGVAIWKSMIESAVPAVLILFVGAWSDRSGVRKPCMLIPLVGEFLAVLALIFCTYFFDLPVEVNGAFEAIFPAITGGWYTMYFGVFSYLSDITSVETRTLRLGIADIFCSLGVPVGLALSGILYKKFGFYFVFCLSGLLYLIGFVYGCMFIKEANNKCVEAPSCEKQCGFVRDFFDLRHVVETFKVTFKNDEKDRKTKLLMLMIVIFCIFGPMHGDGAIGYLYGRYRLNWDEVDFSIFATYSVILGLIGVCISIGLFSHALKVDDSILGLISCVSRLLSCLVYAFATTKWMFYLGPIVEIFGGTAPIAMRSMISKLVPSEELGKVNSLFGVCESLMPLVYGPLYNAIYVATLEMMAPTCFLLSAALTIPGCAVFFWLYTKRNEIPTLEVEKPEENHRRENSAVLIINTAM